MPENRPELPSIADVMSRLILALTVRRPSIAQREAGETMPLVGCIESTQGRKYVVAGTDPATLMDKLISVLQSRIAAAGVAEPTLEQLFPREESTDTERIRRRLLEGYTSATLSSAHPVITPAPQGRWVGPAFQESARLYDGLLAEDYTAHFTTRNGIQFTLESAASDTTETGGF